MDNRLFYVVFAVSIVFGVIAFVSGSVYGRGSIVEVKHVLRVNDEIKCGSNDYVYSGVVHDTAVITVFGRFFKTYTIYVSKDMLPYTIHCDTGNDIKIINYNKSALIYSTEYTVYHYTIPWINYLVCASMLTGVIAIAMGLVCFKSKTVMLTLPVMVMMVLNAPFMNNMFLKYLVELVGTVYAGVVTVLTIYLHYVEKEVL